MQIDYLTMTSAEICALSQSSLDQVRALKQDFDAAFEVLAASGSKEDLERLTVLRSKLEQELHSPLIARNIEQVSDKTLIYIGKLESGIFKQFPDTIAHIYTSLAEGELHRADIQTGGKTAHELLEPFKVNGGDYQGIGWLNKSIIIGEDNNEQFQRALRIPDQQEPDYTKWKLKPPEVFQYIFLSVADLGFSEETTVPEILDRAQELGLELCPADTAPQLYVQPHKLPNVHKVSVGMDIVTTASGAWQAIFSVLKFQEPGSYYFGATPAEAVPEKKIAVTETFVFRLPTKTKSAV